MLLVLLVRGLNALQVQLIEELPGSDGLVLEGVGAVHHVFASEEQVRSDRNKLSARE